MLSIIESNQLYAGMFRSDDGVLLIRRIPKLIRWTALPMKLDIRWTDRIGCSPGSQRQRSIAQDIDPPRISNRLLLFQALSSASSINGTDHAQQVNLSEAISKIFPSGLDYTYHLHHPLFSLPSPSTSSIPGCFTSPLISSHPGIPSYSLVAYPLPPCILGPSPSPNLLHPIFFFNLLPSTSSLAARSKGSSWE